jgi:signal transduction histidine kinase
MVADITERKQAEEAVASVSRKLIEAQESERGRIARDLHDDIGQRLSLSAILLEELQQRLPADAQEKLSGVQKQISEITTDVHTLSHELHSSTLEHLGLAAAMRACCKELSGQTKADIQFRAEGVPKALPREIALCLFRVLQESLHNAIKHSGVREVGVELRGSSEELDLIVRDGGVGFDPKAASHGKGLGLVSMQERLKLVRGQLSIDSRCNLGTTVHARVPVPANGGATRGDWAETRAVWRLSEDSGET